VCISLKNRLHGEYQIINAYVTLAHTWPNQRLLKLFLRDENKKSKTDKLQDRLINQKVATLWK
jgi:hypothetical protein